MKYEERKSPAEKREQEFKDLKRLYTRLIDLAKMKAESGEWEKKEGLLPPVELAVTVFHMRLVDGDCSKGANRKGGLECKRKGPNDLGFTPKGVKQLTENPELSFAGFEPSIANIDRVGRCLKDLGEFLADKYSGDMESIKALMPHRGRSCAH